MYLVLIFYDNFVTINMVIVLDVLLIYYLLVISNYTNKVH